MLHSHDKTHSHQCPACDYGPFTRNHYFNGKLLVERDFTDEQRYYVDKLRHHHQRLHGWGVVCGLKVKEHENVACQNRFVCITPGTAVDCCGHDIMVREPECVDLWRLPKIKELKDKNDTAAHKLQICLRYRECPTEDIPVLYDECGCDDTQCAPNRILESYEFDVILDGPNEPGPLHSPKLVWENTVGIAHAELVALHDATHRLYVVNANAPATIDQVSTENHSKITSRTLANDIISLAVSKDGTRLYVVTDTDPRRLVVLKAETGLPDFNTLDLPNSTGSNVTLAIASDGRLNALLGSNGDLLRFHADLDTVATSAAPVKVESFGAGVRGLTLSSDGKNAFSVGPNAEVKQIKDIDATPAVITIPINPALPAGTKLLSPVMAATDLLAVADDANSKLYLLAIGATPTSMGSVTLAHKPIDLVMSPGGQWIYVLEKDTGGSFVQPVSVAGTLKNPSDPAAAAFQVGNDSREIVISESGERLYIPFVDDPANAALGGVAVVEVSEDACAEILWRDLEGCPHCKEPNCIVLATIENYRFGDKILPQIRPPDPNDDNNNIARIDNRLGRRLLPSTQVLTELIQCLLEHQAAPGTGPGGGVGPTGPPGKSVTGADAVSVPSTQPATAVLDAAGVIHFEIPRGEKGETGAAGTGGGITDVTLEMVGCATEGFAGIVTAGEKTTLELVIPTICDLDLAEISGISWPHASEILLSDEVLKRDGLLVAFNHPVFREDIHRQSVMLLGEQRNQQGPSCWCETQVVINPITFQIIGDVKSAFGPTPAGESANGVQFRPPTGGVFAAGNYRVVVKGDFIRDAASKKAVDANHMPPWFSSGPGYKTGDGVAGGTFESWFQLKG